MRTDLVPPPVRKEGGAIQKPILGDPLEQYLQEVNRYPLLTRKEEYELAKRYQETGDPEAARALVTANLRFVVKIAYQFSNYNIKLTDLVQEGNIGLMKAVSKYNPDRGFRLISYAVWWIKAYIQNYIIQTWSLVRVGPVSQQRRVLFGKRNPEEGQDDNKAKKAKQKAEQADDDDDLEVEVVTEPGDDEETYLVAAEALEASRARKPKRKRKKKRPTAADVEQWRKAAMAARRDMSIDATISEDGRMTLAETLSTDDQSIEDEYASAELTELVAARLKRLESDLNDKEIQILRERLLSDDPRTLQDIGEDFGVSRERVRQIESALKKKIAKRLEGLSPIGLLEGPSS